MTIEQHTELQLLQLRSAIADKEWAIACANMETAKGGWTCDWHHEMQCAQVCINQIQDAIAGR